MMHGMKRKPDRRTQILETMLRLAGEAGPESVRTKALAEEIGVSEPALYRHFPGGKAEMWGAVAGFIGERMASAWQRAADAEAPAPERLRQMIGAQLAFARSLPALPAILFSRALHEENPALRAGIAAVMARFHARLQAIVEDGVRRGEIRAEADAEASAWLLIAAVQGTALRWSLSGRSFDMEAEGRRIMEAAIRGLETA